MLHNNLSYVRNDAKQYHRFTKHNHEITQYDDIALCIEFDLISILNQRLKLTLVATKLIMINIILEKCST